jgi:AraC-like DNA-binding protein
MTFFLHFGISIALFSSLLALSKRPHQVSDKILVVFLMSIIFPMAMMVFGLQALLIDRLSIFMPLTLGPLMLIYTESLIIEGYSVEKRKLLHFLPFVICLSLSVWLPQRIVFSNQELSTSGINVLEIIYVFLLMLSFLVYSFWIHRRLKHHRQNVLDFFTHTSTRITLGWLTWVVLIFFNIFILVHIPRLLRLLTLRRLDNYGLLFSYAHSAGFVLFIVVLSYFAVRQSQIYQEPKITLESTEKTAVITSDLMAEEQENKKIQHNKTSLVKDEQLEVYLETLEAFMQVEKPYLDNDLTLAQLAEMLKMPKHHLTEVINRKLGKNFFNYINDYRISEVKNLLQDPQCADMTILTLAFKVGFNSKTTFNTFFKKSTQMTPTQYRKRFSAC